jgi:phage-related holin
MKHPWILEVTAFLSLFFANLAPALFAIGFLIMMDTITGIWAAYKNGGRKSITSRKGGRIVMKLILYPAAVIVAKVAEEYLLPEIPFLKVTLGILATVEVKSVFENMSLLLGFNLWDRLREKVWKDKEDDEK